MRKFEVWQSKTSSAYTLLEADGANKSDVLESDAVLVARIEADSYEDAKVEQHKLLGWEPYKRAPRED